MARTGNRPIKLGYLTSPATVRLLQHRPNRFQSLWKYRIMADAARRHRALLYLFSERNVNFRRKVIRGIIFLPGKNKWVVRNLPFPDVLYDRQGRSAFRVRKMMSGLQIPRVNPVWILDKWRTYQVLSRDAETRKYLPYTAQFHPQRLRVALRNYSDIFLKAHLSTRSSKIMQVARLRNGTFRCSHLKPRAVSREVHTLRKVNNLKRAYFGQNSVLLQQGIALPTFRGRRVDFRAELQRNGHNQLEIVGVMARIGRKHSPFSSLATAVPMADYYKKMQGMSVKPYAELENRVHAFLKTIYRKLERHFGPFGELGLDFAIDVRQRLWFIEGNARTAKVSLSRAGTPQQLRRAYTYPVAYAAWLGNNKK